MTEEKKTELAAGQLGTWFFSTVGMIAGFRAIDSWETLITLSLIMMGTCVVQYRINVNRELKNDK